MLLYATGYMLEGFPVDRVVLVSWPRTKSSLDDMYAWEHIITAEDIQGVIDLIKKTEVREELAKFVVSGELNWMDMILMTKPSVRRRASIARPSGLTLAANPNVKNGCPGVQALKK